MYFSAIQNLAGVQYSTSEQHQQATAPRLVADNADFDKIHSFIEEQEPFGIVGELSPLINIVTGVEAGDHVTCHTAIAVGNCILNNMIGKDIYKYKFKRNMAIKTMNSVTRG